MEESQPDLPQKLTLPQQQAHTAQAQDLLYKVFHTFHFSLDMFLLQAFLLNAMESSSSEYSLTYNETETILRLTLSTTKIQATATERTWHEMRKTCKAP